MAQACSIDPSDDRWFWAADQLPTKRCGRCKRLKALGGFYKKRVTGRVGRQSWCKDCIQHYGQQRKVVKPKKHSLPIIQVVCCKECGARFVPVKKQRGIRGIGYTCFDKPECARRFNIRRATERQAQLRRAKRPASCEQCGGDLPTEGGRRRRFCKACAKLRMKQSSRKSYEKRKCDPAFVKAKKAALAEFRVKNKDRILKRKRSAKYRRVARLRSERIKSECLKAYGGEFCAYCGSTEKLCLHHVNGDGKRHRKQLKARSAGSQFYSALRTRGYPKNVPMIVLCEECHYGHKPDPCKPANTFD